MSHNYEVSEQVATEMQDRMERRERELASRPHTINILGRIYPVNAQGELTDNRAHNQVMGIAAQQANTAVQRGIKAYNRGVHPSQRIDIREASDNEISAAYQQILAEGRYRAEHGQSGQHGIDLGDVVNGELG